MKLAFFSAKQYDINSFNAVNRDQGIEITFLEPALDARTAILADGHHAVCAFVNDSIDADTLQEFHKLDIRFIALRSAGTNNVDLHKAKELGLKVVSVPAYSPEAIAEFAVGLMLTVIRKYHKSYSRVRDGNFTLSGLEGYNLQGRTVGLVGTGKIGLNVGRILARGFQSNVIAFDVKRDVEGASAAGITYVDSLDDVLAQSDIVSLHAPLLDSTRHIINAHALQKMKHGSILVNTSRGALIDSHALVACLKTGKLRAVALDVYDGEQEYFYKDSSDKVIHDDVLARLMSFHNVFITGHQAFLTEEALSGIAETTLKNLKQLSAGEKCPNEVSV